MPGLTLGVRNIEAVKANLRQYGEQAKENARSAAQASADRLYEASQALCPVDSGFMKEHERKEMTPAGYGYRVGFQESDFTGAGREFYPLFVIFGTRFMAGRDFLFAPAAAEQVTFRRELKAALSPRGRKA
jgi:hypothetical protein